MIGDHLQALPVGHSGAMATMQRRSGRVVELTAVHRFRDPAYAALSLRLREPAHHADAIAIAQQLAERGQVEVVATEHDARERMVDAWLHHAARRERIALVTATNAEAQQINDRIQQERLDRGQLTADRFALGQHGQHLLAGDIVQTRRNDTAAGVDNRATWIVTGIRGDRIELASITDSADRRTITADYAAEYVHLAYACTVYGIQGETVHVSYVGPGVDASGLYVGMTRGRAANTALTVARGRGEAIERLADTMMRGRLEITLEDGRGAARSELGRSARAPDRREAVAPIGAADTRRRAFRDAIRKADVRVATVDAAGHGRTEAPNNAEALRESLRHREVVVAALATEGAGVDALVRDYLAGAGAVDQRSRDVRDVIASGALELDAASASPPDVGRSALGL
jgi:exodeoxyribonuclease V alpha subunit